MTKHIFSCQCYKSSHALLYVHTPWFSNSGIRTIGSYIRGHRWECWWNIILSLTYVFFTVLHQTGILCHKWNIVLSDKRNFQKAGIINCIKGSFIYKIKFKCIEHIWNIQVNLTKLACWWWDSGMEEKVVHVYLSLLPSVIFGAS